MFRVGCASVNMLRGWSTAETPGYSSNSDPIVEIDDSNTKDKNEKVKFPYILF